MQNGVKTIKNKISLSVLFCFQTKVKWWHSGKECASASLLEILTACLCRGADGIFALTCNNCVSPGWTGMSDDMTWHLLINLSISRCKTYSKKETNIRELTITFITVSTQPIKHANIVYVLTSVYPLVPFLFSKERLCT